MKVIIIVGCLCVTAAMAVEDAPVARFVFEGNVTEVGPDFTEKYRPGDVLSGTVGWLTESANLDPQPGFALYRDLFVEPEFIIDRNYIQISGGSENRYYKALALSDAQQGGFETDKITVMLSFDTPEVINNQFGNAWLEITLTDSKGEMVEELAPPVEPPNFEAASFSLFYARDGERVIAVNGEITLFGRLQGSTEAKPSYDELAEIVFQLDDALLARDAYIQDLLSQLEASQERIRSLEQEVTQLKTDLVAVQSDSEMVTLQERNALLRKQLQDASVAQAATAELIRKLNADEAALSRSNRALLAKVESMEKLLAPPEREQVPALIESTPQPMLAHPNFKVPSVPDSVDISSFQEAQPEPPKGDPAPLIEMASDSSRALPDAGFVQFPEEPTTEKLEEVLAESEARPIRRGPRR